jgi:UDP-N-acetylmuramoylalanine--D-glutamate ligase
MVKNLKRVAVYGMGKSGIASLKLAKLKGLELYAVNKGDPSLWYESEKLAGLIDPDHCFEEMAFKAQFADMDGIVLSPGIPVTHTALNLAVEKKTPILSEIEFAYQYCSDVPVIAITGTNGKTTTTTMITEALELAGKNVFCGGNIGVPYCELPLSGKKYDFAVIEVSSFQLETITTFHPKIALILNVFPNHSERYDDVHDYARAKFFITKNMTTEDHLILGTENPYLDDLKDVKPKKHFFTKGQLPTEFKLPDTKVKGEHNEANFYATFKVLELLGLTQKFDEFAKNFAGVAHRLEFVLTSHGLSIYNDAKSTNALATTTAIKAFKDDPQPLSLILGGKLRSENDRLLPDLMPFKSSITRIYTIGDVTDRLADELGGEFEVIRARDLKSVFELVKKEGVKGNLVFSPAFPSFDQFKNYVDRGEKFKAWAREAFNV